MRREKYYYVRRIRKYNEYPIYEYTATRIRAENPEECVRIMVQAGWKPDEIIEVNDEYDYVLARW